ncbi:MAG: hypothetical protein ABIE22_02890 [archaeon]
MEQCFRCLREGSEVKLLDAIDNNEIIKICEQCALVEDVPVIRRPTSYQLKETQKPYTVYQRLSRMAGMPVKEEDKKVELTLDKIRKPKDYSEPTIRTRYERAEKINKPLHLIDNFHWHIQQARRKKRQTLGQVAAVLGESEVTLKMLEEGKLTDDGDKVIGKIEQYFGLRLRKGEALKEQERIAQAKSPARVLNFDDVTMKNITISDLQRMKEEREKAEMAVELDEELKDRPSDSFENGNLNTSEYEEKKSRGFLSKIFSRNKGKQVIEDVEVFGETELIND